MPGADPRFEGGEASRGPAAIQNGENGENPIGEGITRFFRVLREIGRIGVAKVLGPGGSFFNEIEKKGEPLVSGVREELKVGG